MHYIYRTTSPSGKYYIGRHSTTNIDDGYIGSGKWILQMSAEVKLTLVTEIVEFANDFDSLLLLEKAYISDHINQLNNMNFNNSSVGFPTGNLNWNCTPEARANKSVEGFTG